MKYNDAVRQIMKEKHLRSIDVADLMGRSVPSINGVLFPVSPGMETVLSVIDALGYKVVVQPRTPGRRPHGQIPIEFPEKGGMA